jgi:hypothetical protein
MKIKTGLTDGLVRISVGIEDAEGFIADLGQMLENVARPDLSLSSPKGAYVYAHPAHANAHFLL